MKQGQKDLLQNQMNGTPAPYQHPVVDLTKNIPLRMSN